MNDAVMSALVLIAAASVAVLAFVVADLGWAALQRHRERFTARAHVQLRHMFVFIDPVKLYVANVACTVIGGTAVFIAIGSPWLALVTAVVMFFAPPWVWRFVRRRRLSRIEQQLPDALMNLAGGLRAGVSLSVALQSFCEQARPPLAQEFELMLREQRMGVTLEESLNHLARRVPTPAMGLVVSAIKIASETGGGLAETLERVATTLRNKFVVEGKIAALTAQGKLQAIVVGAMPVLLLYVLNLLEPHEMDKLWHTPIGWATLAVIVALESLGLYLIRRITSIDV